MDGYEADIEDFIITNIHEPETVDISIEKVWDDNDDQDGIRPDSITVNLLADGEKVDSAEVTAVDDWKFDFTGKPKYNKGEEIEYTVEEEAVDGYEGSVKGYIITNVHTPEKITVEGEKIWDDEDDKDEIRPDSITVNLLADGEKVDSVEVTAEDEWKFSFENLPKYSKGKEIEYTVTEDAVEGYECSIDGFTITNTHTPTPDTGDTSNVWLYACLMSGAALVLIHAAVFGRKKNRDNE